ASVIVVPQSMKSRLLAFPRILAEALDSGEEPRARLAAVLKSSEPTDPFALTVTAPAFHTRAFLKIQDGCDCHCAYCRVPLARGRSVSLGLEETLRRAAALQGQGRREIVLTGVNISAWRDGGTDLSGLLRRLLESAAARIRLTSIEPESIIPGLVDVLAEPRICPHFHIPVQSGSDRILPRMGRRYLSHRVIESVRRLREARGDPFIAADFIVGFPGETEEDFQETREMISRLDFAALHVFPFSPRPGTAAASMKPVVPERVRRARARALTALSREHSAAYARRWLGRGVDVLLEAKTGARAFGVSGNYLKVFVEGAPRELMEPGRVVRAVITKVDLNCTARFVDFVD
ncbi:MAG: MiaB/RimO family radical SAM methylthiotransferase, partial [Spirochaetia bacterium]